MSAAYADLFEKAGQGKVNVNSVKDVAADVFIAAYAQHLKKANKMTIPEWVDVVKTGITRELPPLSPDWYYIRAASVARKVYLNGGIGVGALARWYGGKKSHGNRPEHFQRGARGLLRHILQNLEKADLVEATGKGGRRVTKEGQKELDTIARNATQ